MTKSTHSARCQSYSFHSAILILVSCATLYLSPPDKCTLHLPVAEAFQANLTPSLMMAVNRAAAVTGMTAPLYQSRDSDTDTDTDIEPKSYTVQVTHENKTIKFQIKEDESILQALERSKVHDKLALPSLPQECRRGNCLTCSGRLICSSTTGDSSGDDDSSKSHRKRINTMSNVEIRKDGLSPNISRTIQEKGIVPTCSSFVVGEGVHFELGVCDDVWREIYGTDSDDIEGERIRNDAVAKAMRLADEKNLNRWALKTRRMLEKE